MISQKYRFHGHASLKYVFKNGILARGKILSVKAIENHRRRHPRIAVVVSKKVLKHAVDRNRARRRIYEVIRSRLDDFVKVVDVAVIVYQDKIITMSHAELTSEIDKCLTKLGIVGKADNNN